MTQELQTQADKQVLSKVHERAELREMRQTPKYEDIPLACIVLHPGRDVVWLWQYHPENDPIPVPAIVLYLSNGRAQISAALASGPIVLWVNPTDCDRPRGHGSPAGARSRQTVLYSGTTTGELLTRRATEMTEAIVLGVFTILSGIISAIVSAFLTLRGG
jgi:hypothetical protein